MKAINPSRWTIEDFQKVPPEIVGSSRVAFITQFVSVRKEVKLLFMTKHSFTLGDIMSVLTTPNYTGIIPLGPFISKEISKYICGHNELLMVLHLNVNDKLQVLRIHS